MGKGKGLVTGPVERGAACLTGGGLEPVGRAICACRASALSQSGERLVSAWHAL